MSDLHGEDQAFSHVLRNASGAVKRKVNEIFSNTLRESEKKELCSLIYYPEDKLELIKGQEQDLEDWYQVTLNNWYVFAGTCPPNTPVRKYVRLYPRSSPILSRSYCTSLP